MAKAKPVGGGADKNIFYKNYTNAKGTHYQILGNLKTGKATVRSQNPRSGVNASYEAPSETWAQQGERRNARGSEGPKKPTSPLKKSTTKKASGPTKSPMATADRARAVAAAKKKAAAKKTGTASPKKR